MWFSTALKRLTEGEFVCKIRYPDEYEALDTPEGRERANAWLGEVGYRLCQLEEGGAFFMGYATLDQDAKVAVRQNMLALRDMLWPTVRYLETVRRALGSGERLEPGQDIALSTLAEAVKDSPALDRRLQQMKDVYNSRTGEASIDRLSRILELLEKDGYLHLANPSHSVYLVTGKIKYLYQLLAIMEEHTPQMAESAEPGADDQMDLAGAATGGEEGAEARP